MANTFEGFYKQAYQVDRTILNKLEVLLTNQESNDEYLDHKLSLLLEEPLLFLKPDNYDFSETPREALLEVIELLKEEKNELATLFIQVDNERRALRAQNFKLMEKLFVYQNFKSKNLDNEFNSFLSRSIFVQYELLKKFLEIERQKNEDTLDIVREKDDQIEQLKMQVQQLNNKVVQAREMWKKSILDPSTPQKGGQGQNQFPSKLSTFESTTDTIQKQAQHKQDYNNFPTAKKVCKTEEAENEIETSINDKLAAKMKQLIGEKSRNGDLGTRSSFENQSLAISIPDDDPDFNRGLLRNATTSNLSSKSAPWDRLLNNNSPFSRFSTNEQVSSVSQETPPNRGTKKTGTTIPSHQQSQHGFKTPQQETANPGHRHTRTPSFTTKPEPVRGYHKPTESQAAKMKGTKPSGTEKQLSQTATPPNTNTKAKPQASATTTHKNAPSIGFGRKTTKATTTKNPQNMKGQKKEDGQQPTLSFLLDQNVSNESINLNVSDLSNTFIKELDADTVSNGSKNTATSSTHVKGTKTVMHSRRNSREFMPSTPKGASSQKMNGFGSTANSSMSNKASTLKKK